MYLKGDSDPRQEVEGKNADLQVVGETPGKLREKIGMSGIRLELVTDAGGTYVSAIPERFLLGGSVLDTDGLNALAKGGAATFSMAVKEPAQYPEGNASLLLTLIRG